MGLLGRPRAGARFRCPVSPSRKCQVPGSFQAVGAGQRLRRARRAVRQRDRLIEQLRVLGRGKPLAFLAGRLGNEVIEDPGRVLVWVFLRHGTKGSRARIRRCARAPTTASAHFDHARDQWTPDSSRVRRANRAAGRGSAAASPAAGPWSFAASPGCDPWSSPAGRGSCQSSTERKSTARAFKPIDPVPNVYWPEATTSAAVANAPTKFPA